MVAKRIPASSSSTPPPPPPALTERPFPIPRERIHRPPFSPAIVFDAKIVLNIYRNEDNSVREVVGLRDIVEEGKSPSWEKLVQILSATPGLFDEESDMMLFDRRICVRNRRQFLAALQWVTNGEECSRNINVPIYDAERDLTTVLWPKRE